MSHRRPDMPVTRAEELDALAERVEKLTGADREVDRHVHWVGLMRYRHLEGDNFLNPETGLASCFKVGGSPKYTSSIDTAMTLVPDGWHTIAYSENNTVEIYDAQIRPRRGFRTRAQSVSLAAAITAACLRAQASIIREAGR